MLGYISSILKRYQRDSASYPFVLTSDDGACPIQASHHASIVAIAVRKGEASLIVTEEFSETKVAAAIRRRLENAGWNVALSFDSAENIQNRYYSKSGETNVTSRSISSYTAIFDQQLKQAIEARAVELRYHVRQDTCGIVHNIDGRVFKAMSIDGAQGRDICSNAYTSLADRKSLEAGKNTFNGEQDQSCVIMREIDGEKYKLRYQSLPEADGGFDVTMRILRQGQKGDVPSWKNLSYTPSAIRIFERAMRRRNGAIYMSGPVGGGKTTALYAGLYRPVEQRKNYVLTFEDPPEYTQYGITRVPVEKIGYANAVKRALRMGAHTVMIGEIRDHEMGQVAKVLSETGQKVVTTVHVNNMNQIIGRLCGEEIGLPRQTICDPDMIAGLFYTTLLPRLCSCKLPATQENLGPRLTRELARLGIPLTNVRVPNQSGCGSCREGRKGRVPIVEMYEPDEHYLRLMRESRDGEARDYWLGKCTTPVTDEDVTGKPKMATALYRVAIGELYVGDLEEGIDLLDMYHHRQQSPKQESVVSLQSKEAA